MAIVYSVVRVQNGGQLRSPETVWVCARSELWTAPAGSGSQGCTLHYISYCEVTKASVCRLCPIKCRPVSG